METLLLFLLIILIPAAFFGGRFTAGRTSSAGWHPKRIEEYAFYPFVTNPQGVVEFSMPLFLEAVDHLLHHKNPYAARQLIIIGEQNRVRDLLPTMELNRYLQLYKKYDGPTLLSEHDHFLENYKRIVTLLGKSFQGTGIEILLHNLVNPTKSIIAIENGEVTGRKIENGTTNLLLDLKTRKAHNQDKLNYEIQIGSRLFKCTTIPIFRDEYGLVGAICINVDVHFIKQEVMNRREKLEAFIAKLVKTDFQLQENILSKEEYQAALNGKRHFADDILLAGGHPPTGNRLMALFFSDIVEYSGMMEKDQQRTLQLLDLNRKIHLKNISGHRGHLLKEIGDGILASFHSVSDAVDCAIAIQQATREDPAYRLRIGIHLGEVHSAQNDIFGDGVNIVSRIQSLATPGGICMTGVVYDNIKNKITIPVTLRGEYTLKNLAEPVTLYEILRNHEGNLNPHTRDMDQIA